MNFPCGVFRPALHSNRRLCGPVCVILRHFCLLCLFFLGGLASDVFAQNGAQSEGEFSVSSEDFDFEEEDDPWLLGGFVRQLADIRRSEGLVGSLSGGGESAVLTGATRLRLGAEYKGEIFFFESALDLEGIYARGTDSLSFQTQWGQRTRHRVLGLESVESRGETLRRAQAHRLNVAWKTSHLHVTIGRQAIGWGQSRFLNPLDLLTPRGPDLIDSEDLPGADAFNVRYFFNESDSLQAVFVPDAGPDAHQGAYRARDQNGLLRYQATIGTLDLVFLGGRHFHSRVLGTEFVLAYADASFRLAYLGRRQDEPGSWTQRLLFADFKQNTYQVVLGAGYAFFRGKLRTSAELFYNSNPYGNATLPGLLLLYGGLTGADVIAPDRNDLVYYRLTGRIMTRNPWLIQLSFGGELTYRMSLDLTLIADTYSGGAYFGPNLSFSISDESVWVLGASLNFKGGQGAEFSGRSSGLYSYYRLHF